ncbi:MAG: ParA family protein [Proteobacteria bacterium]|nr:ParA family protein [Pseudomonadota bacterium]
MKFPKIITIACEKGGVGKTTVATNLAVYLRAMREDMPVTILSFDNHLTVDRMFSMEKQPHEKTVKDIFDGHKIEELVSLGQYGVSFIPSSRKLKQKSDNEELFAEQMAQSRLDGVIIIDTGPTIDYFTRSAIIASDILLIPVKDIPSLNNVENILEISEQDGHLSRKIKLLPSIVDGMVKFKKQTISMDSFLRSLSIERGYELMKNSIPRSPKVESLTTNITFQVYPVITHAKKTVVHREFSALAREVFSLLGDISEPKSLSILRKALLTPLIVHSKTYNQLVNSTIPYCPLCGKENNTVNFNIRPDMLFFESGGRTRGFIDKRCFVEDILYEFTGMGERMAGFRQKIMKSMNEDIFFTISGDKTSDASSGHIRLNLLREDGTEIEERLIDNSVSLQLIETLSKIREENSTGSASCLIKLGDNPFPDVILTEKNYNTLQSIKKIVNKT